MAFTVTYVKGTQCLDFFVRNVETQKTYFRFVNTLVLPHQSNKEWMTFLKNVTPSLYFDQSRESAVSANKYIAELSVTLVISLKQRFNKQRSCTERSGTRILHSLVCSNSHPP